MSRIQARSRWRQQVAAGPRRRRCGSSARPCGPIGLRFRRSGWRLASMVGPIVVVQAPLGLHQAAGDVQSGSPRVVKELA